MPLLPGFGAYQILSKLGEGGMGEVYRARDTTLNREVALKVLPDGLAGDPDRLARFRREAQLLASLNHPNIAHIHGFEQAPQTGTFAIVMELVEGPTLADRIKQGPIAPADAWPIARQIADALEAAHDLGIVHRDLKPANIKVRDDGTVKVLDFGLAKALDRTDPASQASMSNSPTLTARATQIGMILGTAAYMAPEQARGRAVDRRADIWAFGVVLYEMLSGRRAFEGEDISITLAGVLKEDVKWGALPADLPPSIHRLLRRCLEKDPKRRLGAISDARLELDEATGPSEAARAGAAPSGIGRKERWIWASLAGVALVVATLFAWPGAPAPEVAPPVTRFGVLPPGDGSFSGNPPRFAISPDGQSLVFSASPEPGKPDQFWLRRLDSMEITPVPGTESGSGGLLPQSPFWSPDGRYLAFFLQTERVGPEGESRLKTVDLQGGGVQTVCDLPSNHASGSWNADGIMLVSSQETKGIQRVPASGGVPTPVTALDASRNEVAHRFPQFLPDGRHFIYQVQTTDRKDWAIYVGSIDSSESRKLLQSEYARFAAPNSLLYTREGNLFAQAMDPATQELTGDPVKIASSIYSLSTNGRAGFSASDNGVLAYSSNPEAVQSAPSRQLTWVDRSGKPLATIGVPTTASRVRLAPDGSRVALVELSAGRSSDTVGTLWVADLGRGVKAPLTAGGAQILSPTWSAQSDRVLFGFRPEIGDVIVQERIASGATPATTLYKQEGWNVLPLDESTDGKLVVLASGKAGLRSLHVLSRSTGTTTPYLVSEFDQPQASLSPDRRFLAYVSNESGGYQVIVQPFPDPSLGKWPISMNGGLHPRWRSDGRELFYVDTEDRLVAMPVTASGRDFVPGKSTPLFTLPFSPLAPVFGTAYLYDVAPDGQRFLISIQGSGTAQRIPLTVTTNWMSLLKK